VLRSDIHTDNLQVDMSKFNKGFYIIEMQSALDAYVGKVVKH
jgi:hypothetical protein